VANSAVEITLAATCRPIADDEDPRFV